MVKRLLLFGFLALSLVFSSCMNRGDANLSASSFFHTPKKDNFRISPDGRLISYVEDYKGKKNIFVLDIESSDIRRLTSFKDYSIQSAFWANDNEIIFITERNPQDTLRLMAINVENKKIRYLVPPTVVQFRWVGPIQVINKNEILISLNDRDPSLFDVYRLNISTGRRELVGRNPGNVVRWLTDYDGELRLAVESDGLSETILVRNSEEEEFRPVINSIYRAIVQPLGFSADNRNRIFALSNRNRDKLALVEIDLATGKEIRILYQHPQVDLSAEGYSKQSGTMEFVEFDDPYPERHFFDRRTKGIFDKLSGHIPDNTLKVIGRDSTFSGFLVRASHDMDPGGVYYYNYERDRLIALTEENPDLEKKALSAMKPVSFPSSDGFLLTGYLTLPKGAQNKVPTIVIPPEDVNSRWVWGYDPEVQFFASRGYAVLQVNTRGIKGFGKEHWVEGFRKWGTTMQDDVNDATRWLINEGVADPSRIGIYGHNMGGYSALHNACYKTDLYACAASYSGFNNLFTYLKEVPEYLRPYRKMYHEMVGDPVRDSEYFRNHSPVFHADKIKLPVFIAQGGRDSRSSVSETNQFVKDLRNKGIPVTYMLKSDEGGEFREENNKVTLYNELAAFFDKYLK